MTKAVTFSTACVGVRFYDGATAKLQDATDETSIILVREPDNKFDANAIAVLYDEMKCGHIPAAQAALIAPLLDALLASPDGLGPHNTTVKRRGLTGLTLTLEMPDEEETPADATEPAHGEPAQE